MKIAEGKKWAIYEEKGFFVLEFLFENRLMIQRKIPVNEIPKLQQIIQDLSEAWGHDGGKRA